MIGIPKKYIIGEYWERYRVALELRVVSKTSWGIFLIIRTSLGTMAHWVLLYDQKLHAFA